MSKTPAKPPSVRLTIRLLNEKGEPLAIPSGLNLRWGQSVYAVKTNADGYLVADSAGAGDPPGVPVPHPPEEGELEFRNQSAPGAGKPFRIKVYLASYGAADTPEGANARLNNLGYLALNEPPATALMAMDDASNGALARFRAANEIDATGAVDAATRARLEDAHDTGTGPLEKH